MIKRLIETKITAGFYKNKAILIFGARQVGKTTLIKSILKNYKNDVLFLNGDEIETKELLTESSVKLKLLFGEKKIIIIDEAQNIENIGLILKIIVDTMPDIQVIATGSSAFELSNKANEPLTGRKFQFMLYPLSFSEMVKHHGYLEEYKLIDHRLIYGYYPEIVINTGKELNLLKLLTNSYLYKDLLILEQIKRPKLIEKILKALALQVGSEVKYNEIAQLVGADNQTVEKYIDILEQAFIIFRLSSFNKNVRNEIKKGKKIYFYDNGIRNAIIGNFLPLSSRQDIGVLWENFIISERKKMNEYKNNTVNSYFWRTNMQQEIDYIEEYEGNLFAYEIKYNENKKAKFPITFITAYNNCKFEIINKNNFETFLL